MYKIQVIGQTKHNKEKYFDMVNLPPFKTREEAEKWLEEYLENYPSLRQALLPRIVPAQVIRPGKSTRGRFLTLAGTLTTARIEYPDLPIWKDSPDPLKDREGWPKWVKENEAALIEQFEMEDE